MYFDVFLPIVSYQHIIESIIAKLSTQKSNNPYQCVIGKKFDIKFHDLSWKINTPKKEISFLARKQCLMQEYFTLEN